MPRVDIKPELPRKRKLDDTVEQVEFNADIYDKVIWLVDLDAVLHNNEEKLFEKYIKRLRRRSNVIILINNPCLEIWYLLHFVETNEVYTFCQDVINELHKQKLMHSYKKSQKYYKKHNDDIYAKLKPYQEIAIDRAKRLGTLNFDNLKAPKAEIYKILYILSNNK